MGDFFVQCRFVCQHVFVYPCKKAQVDSEDILCGHCDLFIRLFFNLRCAGRIQHHMDTVAARLRHARLRQEERYGFLFDYISHRHLFSADTLWVFPRTL